MNTKKARHHSRVLSVQGFFAFCMRDGANLETELASLWKEHNGGEKDEFADSLIRTALEHRAKLKIVLRSFAQDTRYEKIALINRSILLLGMCEMKYFQTPPVVVINEYVDLAKSFGEIKSGGFINGVLDAFRKNIQPE